MTTTINKVVIVNQQVSKQDSGQTLLKFLTPLSYFFFSSSWNIFNEHLRMFALYTLFDFQITMACQGTTLGQLPYDA